MNEIVEFIRRRFSADCKWVDGNCYYFALILKDRFPGGAIYYDVINGHFIYLYNGQYYDWTGLVTATGKLVEWDKFDEYDRLNRQRIIEDCIK